MLGIILWVKCLEESCQQRAAISMQIHACGEKCNWPNHGTDGTFFPLQWGVETQLEGRDLSGFFFFFFFSFSPSEHAKHKRLLCYKGGVCSTLLLSGKDYMKMRSRVPLLLSGTSRTKAVFFRKKEKNKARALMFCETNKQIKGWLTMWSL